MKNLIFVFFFCWMVVVNSAANAVVVGNLNVVEDTSKECNSKKLICSVNCNKKESCLNSCSVKYPCKKIDIDAGK